MEHMNINDYLYFNSVKDDFFEQFKKLVVGIDKIDELSTSESFKEDIFQILLNVKDEDFGDYINLFYEAFGDRLSETYYKIFDVNPNAFNLIDNINTKLLFGKYYYPELSDIDVDVEILKNEWENRTNATDNEKESTIWVKDFLKAIVYDLKEHATKLNFDSKIEYIDEGAYCQVYRIGNEILKLGMRKHSLDKEFSENYITATLDKCFSDSHAIEVSILAKTMNFNEDTIYKIYKEERELGKCWVDCRSKNLGILLRDNLPRYTNLNDLGYKFLGINKESINYKVKGEVVIIDRDFSYVVNEKNIEDVIFRNSNSGDIIEYEDKYQKTKK